MDYRKNFVKAMRALADMDQLLARMDHVFQDYNQLIKDRSVGKIDHDYFKYQLQDIGDRRQEITRKYSQIAAAIQDIKDEFGGEIKE